MDFSEPFFVVEGENVTAVARIVSGKGEVGWVGRVGGELGVDFFFFPVFCEIFIGWKRCGCPV